MRSSDARGLTLVELTVSLAILASMLIAVAGLLAVGARRLHEGGQRTRAATVVQGIHEELAGWGHRELYVRFGHDGSAAEVVADTRRDPALARWRRVLDRDLPGSHAEVRLRPADALEADRLAGARTMRVEVSVLWRDRERGRRLSLCTVRG